METFELNPINGVLTLKAPLDFERRSAYNIPIIATDGILVYALCYVDLQRVVYRKERTSRSIYTPNFHIWNDW